MAVGKSHKEFHALDLGSGWTVPPGYPAEEPTGKPAANADRGRLSIH